VYNFYNVNLSDKVPFLLLFLSPHSTSSPSSYILSLRINLLVIPLLSTLATLVEDRHGLISAANLDLHKVRLSIVAVRTISHGAINILPSGITT
jgi:hypothetical protein